MAKKSPEATDPLIDTHYAFLSIKHKRVMVYRCASVVGDVYDMLAINDPTELRRIHRSVIGGTVRPASLVDGEWRIESHGGGYVKLCGAMAKRRSSA